MENIKSMPLIGQALELFDAYPRLSAWIVLSVGIVGLLIYEARDVGLTAGNWIALIIASVLVAGLCILIVSWEDEDEAVVVRSESAVPVVPSSALPPAANGDGNGSQPASEEA